MSLRTVIFNAIKTIDGVVKTLEDDVIHIPWVSQDGDGTPHYGASKTYKAIIDYREDRQIDVGGSLVRTNAYILILQSIPPNGAAGRTEPIDPRDKVICPDGTTGPIAATGGFVDSDIGRPYYAEIWLTRYIRGLGTGNE